MGKSVLRGSLDFLSLGDLIQVVGPNGGTGVLKILCPYAPEPGLIYFKKGNIVHAKAGDIGGVKAAYALFGWLDGEFEFVEEDVGIPKTINENRMAIILDGNRMLDEGKIEKLGPPPGQEEDAPQEAEDDDTARSSGSDEDERPISYPVIKGPVVDYLYVVSEDEFSEGQTIVEEKTHGSWNWTVLEGMVDIVKDTKKGPIKLYRMGDGAFLGNLASFSFQGSPRNATAVAASDVQLGVLDTQRLTSEYAALSTQFRQLLKSVENRLREVTEQAVALHHGKNNAREKLKNAKLVIRQSSSELGNLFTIAEGRAFIVQHTDIGHLLLAELGPGDFIGKIPFLDIGHEPLNASVLASTTENFKVEKPDAAQLKNEFEGMSSMLRGLVENVSTSVMVASRLVYDMKRRQAKPKSKKVLKSKKTK